MSIIFLGRSMRYLFSLLISLNLFGFGFLQPDEAFKPSIQSIDPSTIGVEIDLGDQIYIYKDKLKIEDADPKDGIDFQSISMGDAVDHEGEQVFEKSPGIKIKLSKNTDITGERTVSVKLSYQGCSAAGLCYEPQEKVLKITVDADGITGTKTEETLGKASDSTAEVNAPDTSVQPSAQTENETDQIAEVIRGGNIGFIVLSFFGFGLLLALTPCVFPMIPIVSSVIVAQGEGIGGKRAFWLSTVYVLSMAVAYTIAGVLAGLFGSNLQAAFQTPWIITLFSLIFVVLALSMFDVYELQVPNFIQSRISRLSGQKGGVIGVAIMGFLSALIVGPCVAAPLAGALIYIGQTGDALLGGVALFALSIGMGIPLLAVGTTAGKFMPKPGAWMDIVKSVFGIMLIGIAIWMISRVLDENITLLLWGALAVFIAVNMGALEPLEHRGSWTLQANNKAIGIIVLLYGLSLLAGGMAGAHDPLHPLDPFVKGKEVQSQLAKDHKQFVKITSEEELNALLEKNRGKRLLVDFYADWCTACKELEEKTFSDESVKMAMDDFVLVQVDLTKNDDASKTISSKYGIFGPPAILFFDEEGNRQKTADIVGFKEPNEFLSHINTLKGK